MSEEIGKISLIIPNYNYGTFLQEAIESVLSQDLLPEEIIIIDDASTDNSQEIINKYTDHDLISKVIINDKNLGIVDNFRKAIEHTSGDWIVFVGADNRIKPDFVSKYVQCIKENPGAAIVYSDILIFGPLAFELAEKVNAKPVSDDQYLWEFPEPTKETLKEIETKNFMHGSSMFSRSWYEKVGGYQKSDDPEDFNLFRSIIKAGGKAFHCNHATLEYRQHSYEQANNVINLKRENDWFRAHYNEAIKQRDWYKSEYQRLRKLEDALTAESKVIKARLKKLESRDIFGKLSRLKFPKKQP